MIGLDTVPPDDRPPANTMLHWAFDTMVGICTMLIALGAWLAFAWWRRRDIPQTKWFLRAVAVSGVAAVVALECGWIVTEVGRQPWIVYNVMRTEDAVTKADGIWVTFTLVVLLYAALGTALVLTLRAMSRRWRAAEEDDSEVPYGPPQPSVPAVSSADAVAAVLWTGVTAYAVFGGADFGAGFWSLVAGRGERGRRARELIDWAIGPVWEANHVWLIFVLVVLWTGVLGGVRVDLLHAVHPAQPGRAGHRAARLGLRVPQDGAATQGPGARRAPLRPLVAAHAVLHGHRRRRRRLGQGAGRQRHGRCRHAAG